MTASTDRPFRESMKEPCRAGLDTSAHHVKTSRQQGRPTVVRARLLKSSLTTRVERPRLQHAVARSAPQEEVDKACSLQSFGGPVAAAARPQN